MKPKKVTLKTDMVYDILFLILVIGIAICSVFRRRQVIDDY